MSSRPVTAANLGAQTAAQIAAVNSLISEALYASAHGDPQAMQILNSMVNAVTPVVFNFISGINDQYNLNDAQINQFLQVYGTPYTANTGPNGTINWNPNMAVYVYGPDGTTIVGMESANAAAIHEGFHSVDPDVVPHIAPSSNTEPGFPNAAERDAVNAERNFEQAVGATPRFNYNSVN